MDKWTNGLKALDATQTRKRLADLMAECRFVSVGLEFYQGQGLRDQMAKTQLTLEKVAKEEIVRLSGMLAEYKSGPPVAEPPKAAEPEPAPPSPVTPPYDAYAAARARAEAKAAAAEAEPAPAPVAPTRPQLPVRGARLPPRAPGRPA